MNNYRIYGYAKKGWEYIGTTTDRDKAIKKAKNLNIYKYPKYMIIEHDYARDEDKIIKLEYLGQECIVKHIDYVPDYKVIGTEIKIREREKNKNIKEEIPTK